MKEEQEVEALARMVGLDPITLAWMSQPPNPPQEPLNILTRYQFVPLSDAEWEVISPHWPTANQSKTRPRDIANALLMTASTSCGWGDVAAYATAEAARQQFKRRAKSGVLGRLPDLLRGKLDEGRHRQVELLARR